MTIFASALVWPAALRWPSCCARLGRGGDGGGGIRALLVFSAGLTVFAGATWLMLGHWLEEALNRPPVVGDSAMLGRAELSVRQMDGPRIKQVGIKLS